MTSELNHGAPSGALSNPMLGAWLLGPVLALMLAAFAVVAATFWLAAVEIDRTVIASSQRLADSAVRTLRREMALWVKDYAYWGATLQNVVLVPDLAWADANIGQYVFNTFGTSATIVVSADGRAIYSAADARRAALPEGFADGAIAALAPLIAEARAAPRIEPVGVSGFAAIDGVPVLASAAAITAGPADDAEQQPDVRAVLLFLRVLDQMTFASLAERFELPELRWAEDAAVASAHACPITDLRGEVLGFVDWNPEMPGDALFRRLMWPFVGIAVGLAAIGGLALWRVIKANRDLHAQARALHVANMQLSENSARVRSALQRAEHATRAKSSFLAGISHELRTPLTAIVGFSQILKLQHRPGQPRSRDQEYAEIIHDSSLHLLNLVNDILDLSKIESGGYELEESWIDLTREARVVRSLLAHEAERRGVEVTLEVANPLPALYGDPKGLRQIFINLLSNALKFTQRGGWARLVLRPEDDGTLTVEVADNGAGIAAADQKEIWEAFKRARNPGLATAEGSGLGLHLVRVLADLHGAEVGLESELGRGTRIWVRFGPERVRVMS